MTDDKFEEEIKIKLHRDISNTTLEYYQKTFEVWIGSSIKDYFHTRNNLKKIISNLPTRIKAELKIHAANALR